MKYGIVVKAARWSPLRSRQSIEARRNALGVGVTQLYNETVVYNHKRHGRFNLGGRWFDFRMKPSFPKKVTREFLMVDLLNNLDRLAEDQEQVLERVKEKAVTEDTRRLERLAHEYGKVGPSASSRSLIPK